MNLGRESEKKLKSFAILFEILEEFTRHTFVLQIELKVFGKAENSVQSAAIKIKLKDTLRDEKTARVLQKNLQFKNISRIPTGTTDDLA